MTARIDHKKEINGLLYLAVAVLLAVSYYFPGIRTGWLGNLLYNGGRGLFGVVALALPVVFLYMALDYFLEKKLTITRLRFTYVLVTVIAVASVLQILTADFDAIRQVSLDEEGQAIAFESVKTLWLLGIKPEAILPSVEQTLLPGGLLGGLLALALQTIAGKAGALVLLAALILSMGVLLFNVSFSRAAVGTARAIKSTQQKAGEALRIGVEQARQRQEARQEDPASYNLQLDEAAAAEAARREESAADGTDTDWQDEVVTSVSFDPPSDPKAKTNGWREQLRRLWSPETEHDHEADGPGTDKPDFLRTGGLVDDGQSTTETISAKTGKQYADNDQEAGIHRQSAYDLKLDDPDWVMSPAEHLDQPDIPHFGADDGSADAWSDRADRESDDGSDEVDITLPAGVHRVDNTDSQKWVGSERYDSDQALYQPADQAKIDPASDTLIRNRQHQTDDPHNHNRTARADYHDYGFSAGEDLDEGEDDRNQWVDRSEDPGKGQTKPGKIKHNQAGSQINIPWQTPSLNLLTKDSGPRSLSSQMEINRLGKKLEKTLESFGINARIVRHSTGPTITRFELAPGPGVKVSRIVNLADDIALNLAAIGVRIEAPIPGKAAIGIEIPNKETTPVLLRGLLESQDFRQNKDTLTVAIGRDIQGRPILCDLTKMPHLLIAGATGSGKSVCINAILMSVLFKSSPDDVKLILIDPKVVELNVYNGIPHLISPVVTDPKKAANALVWAVNEMTRRYGLFAEKSVRDIRAYQEAGSRTGDDTYEPLPLILIVIDELSDLMATTPTEVEDAIARLTAMARAAGIHLIIATQRPSVDVITGVIKANIPSRIAFAVASQIDSRTILDTGGAEKLLGKGDMLYYPQSASKPQRGQGAFISDPEVERVLTYIKGQHQADYDESVTEAIMSTPSSGKQDAGNKEQDELLPQALEICVETGYASVSLLQRRMNVGYPRAARLIDTLHDRGFVGPFEGSKPRKILISPTQLQELKSKGDF